MADGIEERNERKARLEQEKKDGREEPINREDVYDWEPERQES